MPSEEFLGRHRASQIESVGSLPRGHKVEKRSVERWLRSTGKELVDDRQPLGEKDKPELQGTGLSL